MEEIRYYYSVDGTDVHGPVSENVLRQLFENGTIDETTNLCLEGENTWQLPDMDYFSRPAPSVSTPGKPVKSSSSPLEKAPDSPVARIALLVVRYAFGTGTALFIALSKKTSSLEDQAYRDGQYFGAFVASLLFLLGIPALISLVAPRTYRPWIRTIGTACLSLAAITLQLISAGPQIPTAANTVADAPKTEAKQQIADDNTPKAETKLEVPKESANDDSDTSHITRDMLTVTQSMQDKVKASETAERACSFDATTIKTPDDITARCAAITALRVTQVDAITFLQNFDSHCRDALAPENLSADKVNTTIADARKVAHIDVVIQIWQDKIKLSDDHLARLDLLQKNWGRWEAKDGKMLFDDNATLSAYNDLTKNLQDDVKQFGELQKQIFQ